MVARRNFRLIAFALVVLWSAPSFAENSAAAAPSSTSTSTATSFKERYLKNLSASHSLELQGPSTKTLSGNADGLGNNLALNHYTGVTYKLPQNFSIGVTNLMMQTFNKDRNNDMLNFGDPYVTFANSQILNNGDRGFNLYGYVRYYIPSSGATRAAVTKGSANEAGNGKIRLLLAPSQTLFGGKLEASMSTSFYYRLAQNSDAERMALTGNSARNDYYVYYAPNLAWSITPKAQVYVEYFSGLLSHSTQRRGETGKMPRERKNPSTGEGISLGANLFPTKRISVTPSMSWGPKFLLNTASIGVFTTIKLL